MSGLYTGGGLVGGVGLFSVTGSGLPFARQTGGLTPKSPVVRGEMTEAFRTREVAGTAVARAAKRTGRQTCWSPRLEEGAWPSGRRVGSTGPKHVRPQPLPGGGGGGRSICCAGFGGRAAFHNAKRIVSREHRRDGTAAPLPQPVHLAACMRFGLARHAPALRASACPGSSPPGKGGMPLLESQDAC